MEKEWFDNLTDVQKAKLRGLTGNPEDIVSFCREENLDLPDDLLEAVSGGTGPNGCPSRSFPSACKDHCKWYHE